MLHYLLDKKLWNEFLQHRKDNLFGNERELKEITDFVSNERYLPACKAIVDGSYTFSIPKKKQISKNSSGKKRTVYYYTPSEMLIMKYLAYHLYKYDCLFSENLYSFRRSKGVKSAIGNLSKMANVRRMHGIKIDISNYFNSINPTMLLDALHDDIDEGIYNLFHELLTRQEVMEGKKVISEQTGAMAGVPFSPFLANYYLKDMDKHYWHQPVVYMRYADDIILFANTEEELEKQYDYMTHFLKAKGLTFNESKFKRISPGEDIEFLGFLLGDKRIDVSPHSTEKMKAKIKRKARALRRWYIKKGLTPDKAVKAMNKRFNVKFYGNDSKELSWKYWYFPLITTADSLAVIDHYMQQMQRWIFTGRHSKINFKACSYELMKKCGYRPLVAEYYMFKETQKNEE